MDRNRQKKKKQNLKQMKKNPEHQRECNYKNVCEVVNESLCVQSTRKMQQCRRTQIAYYWKRNTTQNWVFSSWTVMHRIIKKNEVICSVLNLWSHCISHRYNYGGKYLGENYYTLKKGAKLENHNLTKMNDVWWYQKKKEKTCQIWKIFNEISKDCSSRKKIFLKTIKGGTKQ